MDLLSKALGQLVFFGPFFLKRSIVPYICNGLCKTNFLHLQVNYHP
jgi:hypothetical protein